MNGHSTDDFDPTNEELQAAENATDWLAYWQMMEDDDAARLETEANQRAEDERGYNETVGEGLTRWTR